MLSSHHHYTTYALKLSISIIKQYFPLENLWYKEVLVNTIYAINVNQMDGYLDAMISPTSEWYIISMGNQINNKTNNIKISQESDIIRLLRKIN